jgi:hypothetical protein
MKSRITFAVAVLVSALGLFGRAEDREKKISRSQLPLAVQKTVDEQSKDATIRGYSREKEGGKTYYEAEMKVNNHSKDVLMDSDGKVMEVEEEVAFESLPEAVKSGLQAQAKAGKIGKVESITKNDKLVAYEAKVITNGKKSEVQVGPNGQTLDHEE